MADIKHRIQPKIDAMKIERDAYNKKIQDKVKYAIFFVGETLYKFSVATGVPRETIEASMKRKKGSVGTFYLVKLSEFYKIDLKYFIDDSVEVVELENYLCEQ